MDDKIRAALLKINARRDLLTRQQLRTLAGQAKHGDTDAAMRGMCKILTRRDDDEQDE